MESIEELQIKERKQSLEQWLRSGCGLLSVTLQAMPGDASFRSYYRAAAGNDSFVVMDAPPPRENCRPYVAIARALRDTGLLAPEIIAADVERGFLLLTDFGDHTYLRSLQPGNADMLYRRALNTLAVMQDCRIVKSHTLPVFTRDFMRQEWAWHQEWFLGKLLGLPAASIPAGVHHCYEQIIESAASQPQVFMHRDYHSANLMVVGNNVGILDFQDAFRGPVTYDLVSLLRDCYIDWPQEQVTAWVSYYRELLLSQGVLPEKNLTEFIRWFDWMGLQRHLKALLTFARKHVRDQQPRYLDYVPRTLNYVLEVSGRYPEMTALHQYLQETAVPAWRKLCAQ